MTETETHANGRSADSLLLTAEGVAEILHCSSRSIHRLAETGKIPPPVRIGGLVRWTRQQMEQWVADGCPARRGRRRIGGF